MGILTSASQSSCWKGLDYYKNKKIINLKQISNHEYSSTAIGTNNYEVFLDIEHARKSTCNCPLANGKKIICKHIVATYFTAFPDKAEKFVEYEIRSQKEYQQYEFKLLDKTKKYIKSLSKQELVNELLYVLDYAPEWVYKDFLRRNNIK